MSSTHQHETPIGLDSTNMGSPRAFDCSAGSLSWDTIVDALDIIRARKQQKKRAEKHLDLKYGLEGADTFDMMEEAAAGGGGDDHADDDDWDDEETDMYTYTYGTEHTTMSDSQWEVAENDDIANAGSNSTPNGSVISGAPPPESYPAWLTKFVNRDVALRKKFVKYDRHEGVSKANFKAAQKLLSNSANTDYPYLHEWRWEAIAGMAHNVVVGKGDLVMADGRGNFAVVKLGFPTIGDQRQRKAHKHAEKTATSPAVPLDDEATRLRKCKAQALRYARIYERLHPRATTVVPMLMNHEGLFMYENGEWVMYRRLSGRGGVGTKSKVSSSFMDYLSCWQSCLCPSGL